MPKYKQGVFKPTHPEKYVGDVGKIIFRQQWELKMLKWADMNPSVLKYASEELVIPYISPVDSKQHRYFVDFLIMVKNRSGEIKKYAVEVKPEAQTMPPKTRNKKRLITETMTYAVNQAKWKAADEFCKSKGIDFIVLTEKHLKV